MLGWDEGGEAPHPWVPCPARAVAGGDGHPRLAEEVFGNCGHVHAGYLLHEVRVDFLSPGRTSDAVLAPVYPACAFWARFAPL